MIVEILRVNLTRSIFVEVISLFEASNIIMVIVLGIAIFGIAILIITEIRLVVVRGRMNMRVPAEFVQGIGGAYPGTGPLDHGSWRLRVRYMYDGQLYETITVDFVSRKNYPSSSKIAVWIDSSNPSVCCYKK